MEQLTSKIPDEMLPMLVPNENCGRGMKNFMHSIEKKYNVKFDGYWDLHQWSVDNLSEFWAEIWNFVGVIYSRKFQKVIDLTIPMEKCPTWFEGAKLNFAENLLKYRDDHIALISAGEDKETETLTYKQLYNETCIYAAAFRKFGVKKGDVIACYMSNRKEAVLAMLAAVSIGAIWTGALPMMGPKAVLNRLSQVKPIILVTVDRFPNNKEEINLLESIQIITDGLPTLRKVIIVPSTEASKFKNISKIKNSCFLDDFLKSGIEKDGSVSPMEFEQVSFSHPIFISFTSGTTGLPKPLVHGSGMLLSAVKSYCIQCDTTRENAWLTMSPAGWGTWNIVSTFLFIGTKIVLFEGEPYFLNKTYIWDLIDAFNISHFFIPASIVEEFEKRQIVPTEQHSLKSLKIVMGVGSVVKPSSYDFMYKILNGRGAFSSLYGCTELMGSPFLVEMTLPVYRGEINAISLGYSIECLDEKGKPIYGKVGELVLTKPAPNLLLGLWGDTDNAKLKDKYFNKYPGKFLLGDNGHFNPTTKGLIVCGRSDDTLKQRGTRFGSSEIYNVVGEFPEVIDSLCVSHYNKQMDERAVLFLKMREGYHFTNDLVDKIKAAITAELTIHHVPDVILQVKDIPYNINGKKLESLVKSVINNKPYNEEMAKNPECLKYYINRMELQDF